MNVNWPFMASAKLMFFCGLRHPGIRFRVSAPSGPMPFNYGHKHHRPEIVAELGRKRWHRRLNNRHLWRACHLYWRARRSSLHSGT